MRRQRDRHGLVDGDVQFGSAGFGLQLVQPYLTVMADRIPSVTIIGDGAMGTVCAFLLADKADALTMWGAFPDYVDQLNRRRENVRFLPGYRLPDSLSLVHEPAEAFARTPAMIVSAVPCQFIRSVWTRLAESVPAAVPIVCVAKGIEVDTLLRPTDIIGECVSNPVRACLSGPSIAAEVAARKPASVVVASDDAPFARFAQEAFSTDYFRVYTSSDVLGVELAGAVKNVIALAAGICDGIDAGNNAKAALLTRGVVELARLGAAMGASPETFRGLAGVGDLFTTCVSGHSRNRTAGERIGRGETAEQAIAATSSVIEGIPTTRAVLELARRHRVEMPIVEAVASVLFDGVRPQDAIAKLMTRRLRAE